MCYAIAINELNKWIQLYYRVINEGKLPWRSCHDNSFTKMSVHWKGIWWCFSMWLNVGAQEATFLEINSNHVLDLYEFALWRPFRGNYP